MHVAARTTIIAAKDVVKHAASSSITAMPSRWAERRPSKISSFAAARTTRWPRSKTSDENTWTGCGGWLNEPRQSELSREGCTETDAREVGRKNSQGALLEFMQLYESLEPDERFLADQVIADWIESENDRKRFDALAMVDRFRIRAAIGQLRRAEAELASSGDHTASYELAKVRRILLTLDPEARG
jgi:hypothetical protein